MHEQTDTLERLQNGDEAALRAAYLEHRDRFLRWANAISFAPQPDLLDLYQETLIIFYQNLRAGKIRHLDQGVAPYLYGIGKKLLLVRRWRTRREVSFDPADEVVLRQIGLLADPPPAEESDWKPIFKTALQQLGDNCRQIIEWFYYHEFPIESIRERLGYNSDEVVRVTKLRCLRKLREIVAPKVN
jgi:RNA polymerase sigma factor (sigma-70 family)